MTQLTPQRRLIVFLRYFADLPYSEIASVCDSTRRRVVFATVVAVLALAGTGVAIAARFGAFD